MVWFSKLVGVKKGISDAAFVSWGLYRLLRRTCPRWIDLLLILVVIGCAVGYLRWQLFGRWIQALSSGESNDVMWPTVWLMTSIALWYLLNQGIATATFIIDKVTNKFFMSFLTKIRLEQGLSSLLGKDRKEDMLARAEEGEYTMRFFIPQMALIVNLVLTLVVGLGIIFAYMPTIGMLLVAASLISLVIELWAAIELSAAELAAWPSLGESTATKRHFRGAEAMKAIQCFGMGDSLVRHLDVLGQRIYDPQLALACGRLPWKLVSLTILLGVYGYALAEMASSVGVDRSLGSISFLAITLINVGLLSKQIVDAVAKQVQGADRLVDLLRYCLKENGGDQLVASGDNTPSRLNGNGDIRISNLTFGYDESKLIFDGFSLEIPRDETVFLVGRNGVGKSTLFNVITQLYQCQPGMIFLGDIDVTTVSGNEVREYARHVPQGVLSLSYTVRETFEFMAGGAHTFSEEQMWQALRLACLEEKIREFPKQLDEPLAIYRNASVDFSGGQKKKLNIAMFFFAALIGRTRIAILDEPFVGIDPESAAKIMQACLDLQCTVIVSMHEVERIPLNGKVVFLWRSDGQLKVSQGIHGELLEHDAEYIKYCAKM